MKSETLNRHIRGLRVRGVSVEQIAAMLKTTPDVVRARIHDIWNRSHAEPGPPMMDPTPEEIAERAAEIRAGWSEYTHRVRAGMPEELYTVPIASVRGRESSLAGD